jgi:hypothetical protein
MKWDLTYTAMYPSATLDDERWYIFFGTNGGLTQQKWDVINVYTYTYIQQYIYIYYISLQTLTNTYSSIYVHDELNN